MNLTLGALEFILRIVIEIMILIFCVGYGFAILFS